MSRVIVVTSGKGGGGKSSISVNLASALAYSKFKVCLIDGDFGLKNLDVMMGLENRVVYDLNDVVEGRCTIEQVLVKDKRNKDSEDYQGEDDDEKVVILKYYFK